MASLMSLMSPAPPAANEKKSVEGEIDRLCELFNQFDRAFLVSVYHQCGQSVPRSVDYLLEITNDRRPAALLSSAPQLPTKQHLSLPSFPELSEKRTPILTMPAESDRKRPLPSSTESEKDDLFDSMDSTTPGTPGSGVFNNANYEARRQQLGQLQLYLQKIGVAGMSAPERRQFFSSNPVAFSDLKRFLNSIGLNGMNFNQLHEYFKQVGLAFTTRTVEQTKDEFLRQLLSVERKSYDQYVFGERLTVQQKHRFYSDGFVLVKNVIPRAIIDGAIREINRCLGQGHTSEQARVFEQSTWCPEVTSSYPILDLLYESPALALGMSIIGPVARVPSAQISLRFPGFGCVSASDERIRTMLPPDKPMNLYVPWPNWLQQWKIDQFPDQATGIPRGQARNYTCSITVFLTEAPAAMSGNQVVFPGAHFNVNETLRKYGGAQRFLNEASLDELRKATTISAPVQLCVGPGDVLISHYLLPHCIAPNISPHVRYIVTFKLHHANHVPGVFRPDAMDDPWLEFDGLRELGVQPAQQVAGVLSKRCASCRIAADYNAKFCAYCGTPL